MNKKDFRFYISKVSIYIFIFCGLFLIQRFIVVNLFDVKRFTIFGKLYAYEVVLAIITFIEIKQCIKITKPK